MPAWFQFKNIKSTAMGVYVLTYPPITLPEERVEFVTVPWRSGHLSMTEGEFVYDDITLAMDCLVRDLSWIDEIAAWLRGAGELVLGNRPDCFYKARVVNQIELTKIVRGRQQRTFTVVFRCQPFRYQQPEPPAIQLTAPDVIENPGNVPADPVITVEGSGDITLMVAGRMWTINGLTVGHIVIDSERMTAYHVDASGEPDMLLTPILSGDGWPRLPPGPSPVSWTGNVGSVEIHLNARWL